MCSSEEEQSKTLQFLYDQDQEQMMRNSSLHFTQRKGKNAVS